eukprot:6189131-Pleurochrysis_carterae.AAC.2
MSITREWSRCFSLMRVMSATAVGVNAFSIAPSASSVLARRRARRLSMRMTALHRPPYIVLSRRTGMAA